MSLVKVDIFLLILVFVPNIEPGTPTGKRRTLDQEYRRSPGICSSEVFRSSGWNKTSILVNFVLLHRLKIFKYPRRGTTDTPPMTYRCLSKIKIRQLWICVSIYTFLLIRFLCISKNYSTTPVITICFTVKSIQMGSDHYCTE